MDIFQGSMLVTLNWQVPLVIIRRSYGYTEKKVSRIIVIIGIVIVVIISAIVIFMWGELFMPKCICAQLF